MHNVLARTCIAFQCVTEARILINALYDRNSDFLCFGENLSQPLMEKFVLNDIKVTAFACFKKA